MTPNALIIKGIQMFCDEDCLIQSWRIHCTICGTLARYLRWMASLFLSRIYFLLRICRRNGVARTFFRFLLLDRTNCGRFFPRTAAGFYYAPTRLDLNVLPPFDLDYVLEEGAREAKSDSAQVAA